MVNGMESQGNPWTRAATTERSHKYICEGQHARALRYLMARPSIRILLVRRRKMFAWTTWAILGRKYLLAILAQFPMLPAYEPQLVHTKGKKCTHF